MSRSKKRFEGDFVKMLKKTTLVLRETNCTYARLCTYVVMDVIGACLPHKTALRAHDEKAHSAQVRSKQPV